MLPRPTIEALLKIPEFMSFRPRREGESMAFYVNAALDAAGTSPQRLEEILKMVLVSLSPQPEPSSTAVSAASD